MVPGTLATEPINDIRNIITAYGIIRLHLGMHSPRRAVPEKSMVDFALDPVVRTPFDFKLMQEHPVNVCRKGNDNNSCL